MNDIAQQIKHVVVLMFENRSFDHVFGAFPAANGLLDGNDRPLPQCYNLFDPTNSPSASNPKVLPVPITPDVELKHDFDHEFGAGMMFELFGPGTTGWQDGHPLTPPAATWPSTNSGFVSTKAYNADPSGHTPNGVQAMSYFPYGALQVLHPLASEFVLCDNWFCDTPGHTLLNRFFMHTAQTPGGYLSDDQSKTSGDQTIFDQITGTERFDWKIYSPNQHLDSSFLDRIRNSPFTGRPITEFAADAAGGTLPFYSFLMCWSDGADTSMHPPSDIRAGENYLAAVYKSLRNGPKWNETLFIVTFDENGGMYDHVVPPLTIAPNSNLGQDRDTNVDLLFTFDFTLLGPRVPAILVSPWLRRGIASTQYQNTSILRFLQTLIGAPGLTARDANAPVFDGLFAAYGLQQPRTDCPVSFPAYSGLPYPDGDLSKPPAVRADAALKPLPYAKELAQMYGHR
jgi:phospholipase C